MPASSPTLLPDGAVVRQATAADLDQVAELLADRGDPEDADDVRLVAAEPAGDGIAVVEVDGRVVATATLLDEQVRVGSVTLPAGQLEMVAADRAYEHRGYVRALANWCHARSAARGHVLQVVIGIPWFYSQFGYHPAARLPAWASLTDPAALSGVDSVRDATASDIPAMAAAQEWLQSGSDVAMPHQAATWRWLVARPGSRQLVVERDDAVVGCCRSASDGTDLAVGELVARDSAATASLIAAAMRDVTEPQVRVARRPGVPGLSGRLGPDEPTDWMYVRVPDPARTLEALRPELSQRLAQVEPDGEDTLLLSFYRSHVRIGLSADGVGTVEGGGPIQAPVSRGGAGMPPEAVGSLLLGGLDDVVRWHRDVHLGKHEELLRVLFPPLAADLLTFYLPC